MYSLSDMTLKYRKTEKFKFKVKHGMSLNTNYKKIGISFIFSLPAHGISF